MIFDENSGLVRIWMRQIQSGKHVLEDVPALGNLREIVEAVLAEG